MATSSSNISFSRKRRRAQQSTLAFSPVITTIDNSTPNPTKSGVASSPLKRSEKARLPLTPAKVTLQSPGKRAPQQSSRSPLRTSDGRRVEVNVPSSSLEKNGKQRTLDGALRAMPQAKEVVIVEDDEAGDEAGDESPVKRRLPAITKTGARNVQAPPPSFMLGSRGSGKKRMIISLDSDEEGNDELSDRGDSTARSQRNGIVQDLDEDDDAPVFTQRSRKRKVAAVEDGEKGVPDAPVGRITLGDDEDDDVVVVPTILMRKRRRKLMSPGSSASDDDDDAPPMPSSPVKRLLKRPAQIQTPPRSSGVRRAHRSEKEKKAELLRRRRAGEKELTLEDLESSDDVDKPALYDDDSDLQALSNFEDEEKSEQPSSHDEDVDQDVTPRRKSRKNGVARPKTVRPDQGRSESDPEDLDGFVVEDDDDGPGIEHLRAEMPLQFTQASRKPLKDHFHDAVEWLVQRRINPAFERDDEMYQLSWRRLDDEVSGLRNSKFVSTVWREDFQRALRARPEMSMVETGVVSMKYCEACGRSGHPATSTISFSGKPYSLETLDDVESDTEDEDEDEDGNARNDEPDYDRDGIQIPPESREWQVGSVCTKNAAMAHLLTHWRIFLKDWVEARLADEGWLAPAKLAERDKMKSRKRRELANDIVDDWEEKGLVKMLYGDFKGNLEMAREMSTTGKGKARWH